MLRFIALSLAVHSLAIGAWYYRATGPEEVSGGRILALALLPPAASTTSGSLKALAERSTQNTERAAQQATPPGPGRKRVPELQQNVPAPAARQQHMPAPSRQTTAVTTGATVDIPETVTRGLASPAAAVSATAPATNNMLARRAVQTAVSIAFKANFRYPRIARRNGWEGTVTLALRVLPDGQLTDILVSSSSGHPVLDLAAIHTLQTASVPQAKHWLSEQAVDLVLPVEYRLLDS
jgi:protein TonB